MIDWEISKTAELIRDAPLMGKADLARAKAEGGIIAFDGTKNWYLSNFWRAAPINAFGYEWQTAEHAYQAMKFLDPAKQSFIRSARSAGEAKRWGKKLIPIRPDWDDVKFQFMLEIVRAKFLQSDELGGLLLQTGSVPLVEGNTWHDNIWGFCFCNSCRRKGIRGLNALGHTLMIVRSELRRADKFVYEEGDVEIIEALS